MIYAEGVKRLELHTGELLLRTVTDDDIDEVSRMWKFEQGSISLREAKEAVEYMQNNHKQNRTGFIYHLCFAIFEEGKDNIIGWCGLDGKPEQDNPDRMEIFYLIDEAYRNKGYATQCALKLLEHAFEVAKIERVFGGCDKDNISSFKVLSKSGMVLFKFEDNGDPKFFIDKDIYEKTKSLRGGNKEYKQKLIIITGSPCVGKTTVSDLLFESYDNSAYCDGDWLWRVNPFSIQDPRLRNGDKNMSFVLSTYLTSNFDYVIFSSVVVIGEKIRKAILGDIIAKDYEVIAFTLKCSEKTLVERHKSRGDDNEVMFDWLRMEPHPGDYVIDTEHKNAEQIVAEMRNIIERVYP